MGTPPSVVLFTVDCLRADHVGCYGYERPTTPHIDTLANEATCFEHSYANSPGTRWALQTIHTGVHTGQIDGLGISEETPSLAEAFAEAGYVKDRRRASPFRAGVRAVNCVVEHHKCREQPFRRQECHGVRNA